MPARRRIVINIYYEQVINMKFVTVTESVYEVDQEAKRIRRLSSSHDPTLRQGADGDWKPYKNLSGLEINQSVTILWGYTDQPTELTASVPESCLLAKQTITSAVKEIIH